MATLQGKLAAKFNKRIADYNKAFGKGYAYNIYTDIDGIKLTKPKEVSDIPGKRFKGGFRISAETFKGPDAENIIIELERRLPAVSKKLENMKAEIENAYYSKGLFGPLQLDQETLVKETLAKEDISARFYDAKQSFYNFMKRKDFDQIYLTDDRVRAAKEALYHKGKWDSYSKMLEATQLAEEALASYYA